MPDEELSTRDLLAMSCLCRIERLIAGGLTREEAAAKALGPESPDEYAERNRLAMESLETRMLSPEYLARFEAIQSEPDPVRRATLSAEMKRENFTKIDMEAVHRTISARNRQMVAEGVLPPDILD